jgi:hypothetical protein
MIDTTFVLTSLNNGYDDSKDDPVENYHLERTIFTANLLKNKFNQNVLFVDWCSKEENKYEKHLPKGIKYIYIPTFINDELHKNNESTLFFYEFISKDIGVYFTETKNIAMINGDNIYTKKFIQEMESVNDLNNNWYAGYRLNIENDVFKDKNLLYNMDETEFNKLKIIHNCNFCYGDFTLCSKNVYDKVGGYNYSHQHAGEDTKLHLNFQKHNINIKHINTPFYHLNHNKSGNSFVSSNSSINKDYIKNLIIKNAKISIL